MAIDLEKFKKNVNSSLRRNEEAFSGQYARQLNELMGLSGDQLALACPKPEAAQVYSKLVSVVKEASRANVAQASLRAQIKALGDDAVAIAKLVGGLAALFA